MPPEASQTEMILAQIESLPTLPSVAMRLLELTSDAGSSAREVVRLVEGDQSIAARILSLGRRAHLGATATTVERAVVLLGFDAVRCLVLSMQVLEVFSEAAARARGQFDLPGLWKHSLAVGCAARLLAQEIASAPRPVSKNGVGDAASVSPTPRASRRDQPLTPASPPRIQPEEAFLCGLLHDIGKVALFVCFPKSYDRVIKAVESNRGSIAEEEHRVFGLDHTIAGRRLAMHWKLPAMIGEAIWLHQQSPDSTPTRIAFPHHVRLVQLADRLVRQMHIGYSGNHVVEQAAAVAESAGISSVSLERVMTHLPELIQERADLIGLEQVTTREVYHGALVQANAELGRISSRLALQQRELEQRSCCLDAVAALNEPNTEEPTHEEILKAAVRGLRQLYPDAAGCAVGVSVSRGISIIASSMEAKEPAIQFQPVSASASGRLSDSGRGWVRADALGAELMDQVRSALGQTPLWCWMLRSGQDWLGALVLGGDPACEPDADSGIDLLGRAMGRWICVAEAAVRARQLHEELASINARLVAAQSEVARMRSVAMVGEMAAGAAHELNNPLAVISGRAQLLNRDGMSDEVRKNAALISEHAHRASELVTALMEFAKPASPAPEALDPRTLLAQIRDAWVAKGPLSAAQIEFRVSDEVPDLWADESQIRILFDELIRNAVEAMAGMDEPCLVVNCEPHPTDDKAVIRIQDNGQGMSAEVLERAATPFYSSRPAGRGRGLGLSRATRYAEINGGRLRVTSEPGRGTEVIVELPCAAS